jgi:hypothetical protein
MIALMALIGEDEFDAYESRLLDIMELFEGDCVRRKDVRMVEKERDWKREVRIFFLDFRSRYRSLARSNRNEVRMVETG